MKAHKPAAVLALSALCCILPIGASAATTSSVTPAITQFSSGLAPTSEPESIAAGPGDTLWFGLRGASAIGRSTLQGGISTYATLDNAGVIADTTGPEDDLWFLETGGGPQVGRLDPSTGIITEYAEPSGAKLSGLTFGPEHELWLVGEKGSESALWRMNAATGAYGGEFKLPTPSTKPTQLTFGSEGDIWFTESNNPGSIGGFEPGTRLFAEFKLPVTNADPTGIATGPEGDIFVAETNAAAIGRLNPMSHEITEFSSGLAGGKPQQIVSAGDGALYFTDSVGAIGRITPAGVISEYTSGLEKTEPWGITVGPDGNIWFTVKNNPAHIGRLTLAPGVASGVAEHLGATSAMLTAKLAARAQETSYFFEYGTTSAYGTRTGTALLGAEPSAQTVTAGVGGLVPRTTYHFRLVATNATGTTYGDDATFTTGAPEAKGGEAPKPGSGLTLAELAEKTVLGSVAGAAPASGTVLVRAASGSFVALSGPEVIPVGAVIEATKGTVRLITALPKKGRTQTVTVWGGRFKIAQSKHGNGLTKIILDGALPACPRKGLAHAAKHAKPRKLWAEDNHGRYSTYGANSVATVLGTEWETIDSCAGTVTRVLKGKVRVRNVHTHKTTVVAAAHSLLARR